MHRWQGSGLGKQVRRNSFATVAMDMLNARSEQLFVNPSGEKGVVTCSMRECLGTFVQKVYWEAFIPGDWCTYIYNTPNVDLEQYLMMRIGTSSLNSNGSKSDMNSKRKV